MAEKTHIGFWADDPEKEAIKAQARKRGFMTVSEYLRSLIASDTAAE